jgi:hypothetical protein
MLAQRSAGAKVVQSDRVLSLLPEVYMAPSMRSGGEGRGGTLEASRALRDRVLRLRRQLEAG